MNSARAICGWLKRCLLILCYPQANICHLCKRSLSKVSNGLLCDACVAKLATYRIPCEEAVTRFCAPIAVCVAAYWHGGEARTLTHRLKYGGDGSAAAVLAQGMAGALAECAGAWVKDAMVVPVPLHPKQQRERGYNQARLLAEAVCAHTGMQLAADALIRVRHTHTQTAQTREERLRSMRGAFAVAKADGIRARRVLLLDDVLTTGGTAVACAEALLAAGACEVLLLTACRADR